MCVCALCVCMCVCVLVCLYIYTVCVQTAASHTELIRMTPTSSRFVITESGGTRSVRPVSSGTRPSAGEATSNIHLDFSHWDKTANQSGCCQNVKKAKNKRYHIPAHVGLSLLILLILILIITTPYTHPLKTNITHNTFL